jgi:ankyrin repeat protein
MKVINFLKRWCFIAVMCGGCVSHAMEEQASLTQQLSSAVHANNREEVVSLLANGADPNECLDGKNALHFAAKNGFDSLVLLLLDNGAAIDSMSNEGTALHLATLKYHPTTVRLLIRRGADVVARDPRWQATPLHCAVIASSPDYSRKEIDMELIKAFIETPSLSTIKESKKNLLSVLCCFARFGKGEGAGVVVPRDVQKIICSHCVTPEMVVEKQLVHLQALFKTTMPFPIAQLSWWDQIKKWIAQKIMETNDPETLTPSELAMRGIWERQDLALLLYTRAELVRPGKTEQHRAAILKAAKQLNLLVAYK